MPPVSSSGSSSLSARRTVVSPLPRIPTMDTESQSPKRHNNVISSLNMAIDTANFAKEILSVVPAQAACSSISVLLTAIKVCFLPVRIDGLRVKTTSRIL